MRKKETLNLFKKKSEFKNTYMNRSRSYGEGDVRINNTINLNEDIYNIGFISMIRDDIMRKYLDVETGLIEKI